MPAKTDTYIDLSALGPTREEQVLALAAQGFTDKQMATKLGISRETVATYWRRILQRFHASSRTEVVATVLQQRADGLTEENQRLLYEIAERRRAEHEMSKTANRLKSLIGSLRTGVLFEDDQRTILYVNDAYAQLFDLPVRSDVLVNMNSHDALSAAKEAFANSEAAFMRIDGLVAAKRPVYAEEVRLANGRVMERDYIPIEGRDGVDGHLWHYRDVTAEAQNALARESYAQLSDIVAAMMPKFIAASNGEIGALIDSVLREVGSAVEVDRCAVNLCRGPGESVSVGYEWAISGKFSQKSGKAFTSDWMAEAMARGKTVASSMASMLPAEASDERTDFLKRSVESVLAIPIRPNHELHGWIVLEARSRREWNESTLKAVKYVADLVGAALTRIQ